MDFHTIYRIKESEKRKRGISKEQVCVLCASDRIGNIIAELICKGRMKHTNLERRFKDRIEDNSILCTDSHKSDIQFAQDIDIELKQIKRGMHKKGIYHIQHINAYHSKLKKWIYRFNGVATKYLANYMYWYIQDVIVMPEFQGKNIGKMIVEILFEYVEVNSLPKTTTTVGLMAVKEKELCLFKLIRNFLMK